MLTQGQIPSRAWPSRAWPTGSLVGGILEIIGSFFESMRIAIESRFAAYWTAEGGGVPIRWSNLPFTQPDAREWVSLDILTTHGTQESIGGVALERQKGTAKVMIFLPSNFGESAGRILADIAGRAFQLGRLTSGSVSVTMRAPSIKRSGRRGAFSMWEILIPFEARKVITRP
jgi:hypothetical protein